MLRNNNCSTVQCHLMRMYAFRRTGLCVGEWEPFVLGCEVCVGGLCLGLGVGKRLCVGVCVGRGLWELCWERFVREGVCWERFVCERSLCWEVCV